MANEPVTTPIHDLYAQRFAADLETNRKEQAELTAQIEELEGRLNQLKADELWLCGVQGVLPPAGESAPASETPEPAKAPTAGAVPRPRQARKGTGGATRAKKAAQTKKASGTAAPDTETKPAARKPAARKSAAKPAAAKAVEGKAKPTVAAKRTVEPASIPAPEKAAGATRTAAQAKKTARTDEPPLRELVHAMLVKAAEPRMVSEVTAELTQAHPGRAASGQVVRNTLEGLVKKGQIEKEHRQGSVMYTAVQPTTAEPAAGVTVAEGPGPVADAVAEPVADTATAPAPAP